MGTHQEKHQEYERQRDSSDAICPYCQHSYQVETEDFSPTRRTETCDECGKKFYLEQEFTVDHITTPDCELNNQEHIYIYFKDYNAEICATCNKSRIRK